MTRTRRTLINVLICIVLLINPLSVLLQTPRSSAANIPEAQPAGVEPRTDLPVEPVRFGDVPSPVTSAPPKAISSLANAIVITLMTDGFQPPTLTVASGTEVAWLNTTNLTHTLVSGEPYRIYLPLVVRSGGSVTSTGVIQSSSGPNMPAANGDLFTAILSPGGYFTYTFNLTGTFTYFLSDNPQVRGTVVVQPSGLPPDPSTVAPPVDQTVATTLISATEFLYTGPNPIQTGVVSGTIKPLRVAVLRGKVLTRDGAALPGVTITILDHPEFGQTLSRADGMFDMAVNGGSQVTVKYEENGYLPLQRQVDVPWQDYVWLPDVSLIPVDPNVTVIDLTSNQMQVARASVISDTRGVRQETLLLPVGTTAVVSLPNGITQTLTTLHVRSTEYTVGPNGEKAMPDELPANSAYTYATEFSVDEVTSVGGTGPSFNQPIISYNENFLSFPVGITVPVGFYDRDRGVWVAADNGRVVKILSITNGKVDLDIDGSGTPANASALAALGVSDDERAQLTTLYATGQSLWRTPITHFSAWDKNQGTSCKEPCPTSPSPAPNPPKPDDSCPQTGSIISCQAQALGEEVSVVGTPFTLHYQSDRTFGYRDAFSLLIPITGPDPASWGTATRIDLHIWVAGLSFTQSYTPTTNLNYRFTWNGRDAYGRKLQGKQPVTIQLCYVYPLVYQRTERFGYNGNATLSIIASGNEFAPCTKWQGEISAWDTSASEGLGGWSLSVHHSYDPIGHVLYLGDGQRRSTLNMSQVITTIAGGLNNPYNIADGIPANQAYMDEVADVIVGSDGSLFLSDLLGQRVRKITTNGIITTVAGLAPVNGSPQYGYNGDGIPATQAKLNRPSQLALGSDGSLYIADSFNNRIRRVGPGGLISTVAGTGDAGFAGDGGPATQATLNNPTGVAVAPDGSLYIADSYNNRIRRVTTDGLISTVAGTGAWTFGGDGGLATQASLAGPGRVAVAPDGKLYISDFYNWRIRQVGVDGIITTTAGNGNTGPYCNGCPATESQLIHPNSISVAPDGSLYLGQSDGFGGGERVRRIAPDGTILTIVGGINDCFAGRGDNGSALNGGLSVPDGVAKAPDGTLYIAEAGGCGHGALRKVAFILSGYVDTALSVASADGSELYLFDANGRHLRTADTLTGVILYQFGYNNAGQIVSITDRDGNVTTIDRDANGKATGIVGPYGQRTSLALDANGYLASITNPAGEAYHFTSTDDGLMTTFTDPKGSVHHFTYDDLGQLIHDDDPAGGSTNLARTELDHGYIVTRTTELSRTTIYQVETLPTGDLRLSTTDPNGALTQVTQRLDGSEQGVFPDGSQIALVYRPDPHWGMQAPLIVSLVYTLPLGQVEVITSSRSVALQHADDLLSLQAMTSTYSVNGRLYTSVYDAPSRTVRFISPEGRQSTTTLDAQGHVASTRLATNLAPIDLTYDNRGRLTQVQQSDLSWLYAYDNLSHIVARTDSGNHQIRFGYDAANHAISTTLPSGSTFQFGYDANGNRTQIRMPNSAVHTLDYTPIDLLASYAAPASPGLVRAFNVDRDLSRITLASGRMLTYTYDSGNRLAGLIDPETQVAFDYAPGDPTDRVSQITSIPASGDLTQTIVYTYNADLPTSVTWLGAAQGTFTYTYDANRFLTGLDFASGPDRQSVTLSRDRDGLLTTNGPFTITRGVEDGTPRAIRDGTLIAGYGYDALARVVSRTQLINNQPNYQAQLVYDSVGHIAQKVEVIAGTTSTYTYAYDVNGRLTSVARNGVQVENYDYDVNDNRTSAQLGNQPIMTATYDAQDRLQQQGGVPYQFDVDGFLIQRASDTFQYSTRGELLQAVSSGVVITYTYDGLGRRVARSDITGTVQYLYGNPGNPFQITHVRDATGVVSSLFYDDGGLLFALERSGTRYYVATDQVGTPRVVSDSSGAVIKQLVFDSFGNLMSDSNPSFELPIGFAGGLVDPVTHLLHFGFRDYDPYIGRWTARDPALYGGYQANLYVYVGNDPIGLRDPLGLFCVNISLYAGVGGGGQVCMTGQGVSGCLEAGFGVGESVSADNGGLADNGQEIGAELGVSCGPVGLGGGVSLDNCGNLKAKANGNVGPIAAEVNTDGEVTVGLQKSLGEESTGCGVEGKVDGKVCRKLLF